MQLKNTKVLITTLLVLISLPSLLSQDSSKFVIVINPIGLKLNTCNWEEYGSGFYKIKNNLTNNVAILGLYKCRILNKLTADFGLGIRQNKFNFDYLITDPFNSSLVIDQVNRYYHRTNIVSQISINYSISKFNISIGFEFPFQLRTKTNIMYFNGPVEIFIDTESQEIAYYQIIERNSFSEDFIRHATPLLAVNYRFSKRLYFNFTGLVKPYGDIFLYQLDILGQPAYFPEGLYQLNDSRINNYNISLYFGIQYSID